MTTSELHPILVEAPEAVPVAVGGGDFELRLPVFEGPLALLLHLIESRQLDILTVPLAEVADAYVVHLAHNPVDAANLSEFVSVAAQLILLKSRRLLPSEPLPAAAEGEQEGDEEELRRRLIEYRAFRDAAARLAELDLASPAYRREPRESDLPEVPAPRLAATVLADAVEGLASIQEPEVPPPEVVAREVTIDQQLRVLADALSATGRVVLQAVLAACRSRTEATVTFMATLELVRRRQAVAEQDELFGPITITSVAGGR